MVLVCDRASRLDESKNLRGNCLEACADLELRFGKGLVFPLVGGDFGIGQVTGCSS